MSDDAESISLAEEFRARAQAAYRYALGAEPPLRMSGESLNAYRVRLLEPVKSASKDWRGMSRSDLAGVARAGALSVAETQIYADAVKGVQTTQHGLREVMEEDRTGRKISKFYGDPEEVWGVFKLPGIRARLNRNPRGAR